MIVRVVASSPWEWFIGSLINIRKKIVNTYFSLFKYRSWEYASGA